MEANNGAANGGVAMASATASTGAAATGGAMYSNARSASLYVGDLAPSTTESQLYDAFSQIGKIQSIRILRDAITRQSLSYAYVNYYDAMDAERAIEILNFQPINHKPCRVMWVQRDPSLRKSGVGNVVIKNLDSAIDNKTLFDTFSIFGNILSCKVATDEEGRSRGFGFVHFDSEAAATGCINDANGRIINGKEVVVEAFKKGHKTDNAWTNLYVKNFPLDWDEAKLRDMFATYGEIKSVRVEVYGGEEAKDKGLEGKSKGFGFVDFAEHESAVKAIDDLHGKKFTEAAGEGQGGEGGVEKELYVHRLQTKKERAKELRDKHSLIKKERLTKYQGCNLYIKNLDESLDDDWLRTTFGKFGTITSARVMRDPATQVSKGFGFVCFSTPEEAQGAIGKMNNKMCLGKPIYVALSQVAQQRREMLAVSFQQQHQQRGGGMMPGPMQGAPFYPNMPPNMMQQPYMNLPYGGPMGGGRPGMMGGQRGMPMQMPMPRPMYRMPDYRRGGGQGQDGFASEAGGQGRQPKPFRGPQGGRRGGGRMGGMQQGHMGGPMPAMEGQQGPYPSGMEGGQQGGEGANRQGAAPGGNGLIDPTVLASASPEEQKTLLGESLYPQIMARQPELAGKITGMILELDNTEILHLLESPEALNEKIQEAIKVLNDYNQNVTKPDNAE